MSTPLEILTQARDDVARLQGEIGEVTSVNGKVGRVLLDKADIDLANVNNTSDLNKPISTATQAALDLKATVAAVALKADQTAVDLKAPLASPALTGTPTTPTATPLTNNTQIASTAYVDSAVALVAGTAYTFSVTRQSTNQTLPSGGANFLVYDTEQWDTGTFYNIADPWKIDISSVTAGKYMISGYVNFAADPVGIRTLEIRVNGATRESISQNAAATGNTFMEINCILQLNNLDQLGMTAQQNSGSNILLLARLGGFRISA